MSDIPFYPTTATPTLLQPTPSPPPPLHSYLLLPLVLPFQSSFLWSSSRRPRIECESCFSSTSIHYLSPLVPWLTMKYLCPCAITHPSFSISIYLSIYLSLSYSNPPPHIYAFIYICLNLSIYLSISMTL